MLEHTCEIVTVLVLWAFISARPIKQLIRWKHATKTYNNNNNNNNNNNKNIKNKQSSGSKQEQQQQAANNKKQQVTAEAMLRPKDSGGDASHGRFTASSKLPFEYMWKADFSWSMPCFREKHQGSVLVSFFSCAFVSFPTTFWTNVRSTFLIDPSESC